jgi:hypothetical protein
MVTNAGLNSRLQDKSLKQTLGNQKIMMMLHLAPNSDEAKMLQP